MMLALQQLQFIWPILFKNAQNQYNACEFVISYLIRISVYGFGIFILSIVTIIILFDFYSRINYAGRLQLNIYEFLILTASGFIFSIAQILGLYLVNFA